MAPRGKPSERGKCQCRCEDCGEESDETDKYHPIILPDDFYNFPYKKKFLLPKFVEQARNRFFYHGACFSCDNFFSVRLSAFLYIHRSSAILTALYDEIWDELRLAGVMARQSEAAVVRYMNFAAIIDEAFAPVVENNEYLDSDDIGGPHGCVFAAWRGASPFDA